MRSIEASQPILWTQRIVYKGVMHQLEGISEFGVRRPVVALVAATCRSDCPQKARLTKRGGEPPRAKAVTGHRTPNSTHSIGKPFDLIPALA